MNKISTKHLMLFFIGVVFISLKTYPSIFINFGGRDTWICALIASVIFIIYLLYLLNIMKKNSKYNIIEIFKIGLSSPLGMLVLFIFALGLFLSSVESAAVYSNAIRNLYFLDTPIWYLVIFFLIPTILMLNKNIRTLLVFVIISVASLIINAVLFALLIEQYKDLKFLMPILENGIDKNFIICTIMIFASLCSILIAIPFMKYLNNSKYLLKHSTITSSLLCAFIVFSILGVIAFFGPLRASNILYAEAIEGQRVQLAGFLEFGEYFFIYQTVIGYLVKYIISSYGFMILFKKCNSNRFIFTLIYTFFSFTFANFLAMNNYYLDKFLNILPYINGVLFFIIPLITFTLFNIRNKNKQLKK